MVQLTEEVKRLKKCERQQLLKDVGQIKVTVPALDGLAMKANLNLPWNKLRSLRR